MRPMRIIDAPIWTWKLRLVTFFGLFSGLWLFIEPMAVFGIGNSTALGWKGYILLIATAILTTYLIEIFYVSKSVSKISFIRITIILTESGTRHFIEVSEDMRVEKFLNLLLDNLSQNASKNSLLKKREFFKSILLVDREGRYIEVPESETLKSAGIINGDTCKIKGSILPDFSSVEYRR